MIAWTPPRRIAVGLAALLVALAGFSFAVSWNSWADFKRCETGTPVSGSIDLSAPGIFAFPFEHSCPSAHGVELYLALEAGADPAPPLHGLSAHLEVLAPDGKVVGPPVDFSRDDVLSSDQPGPVRLFWLPNPRRGSYLVRISIERPAPGLRGVAQELHGDYLLCGLEAMPAIILGGAGAAAVVLALGTVALTFYFSRPGAEGAK